MQGLTPLALATVCVTAPSTASLRPTFLLTLGMIASTLPLIILVLFFQGELWKVAPPAL